MPEIANSFTLNTLLAEDKTHWELHLNAALKDTPSLGKQVRVFLKGGELPNLEHPSFIHDWLEIPELRSRLEAWNG